MKKTPLVLLPILVLFLIPPLLAADLQVHFIDVGQGDSILVIAPHGKKLLIDAGIHGSPTDKRNPFLYIKDLKDKGKIGSLLIDYAVITHNHDDHYKGFSYLSKKEKDETGFAIPTILYSIAPEPYTDYWKSVQPLIARSLHHGQLSARGPPIDLDQDVTVEILYPSDSFTEESKDKNDDSIILKLTYKNVSFLFMADAPSKVEALLHNVQAILLKSGHHGARTSSSNKFLRRVHPVTHPLFVVISCNDKDGKGKTYGHPHKEALKHIKAVPDADLHRTDLNGTVVATTDGENVTIQQERSVQGSTLWQPGKKSSNR